MKKRVFLIRGHSGSGKSAFAEELKHLVGDDKNFIKLSAYNYFEGEFDSDLVPESHEWCLMELEECMQKQYNIIVVHNTFTKDWELNKYISLIKKYDYPYRVIKVENHHYAVQVPEEKIDYQLKNYSPYGVNKKLKPKPIRKVTLKK